MNILLLSVGTRNKIVEYFRENVGGEGIVIATDMSRLAPALYEAHKFYLVPGINEAGYLEKILEICKEESVDAVLSLIDPELSILARNAERFRSIGTTVIGSSYELCERSLNKWEMYQWLVNHGYKCARSYIEKEKFYKDIENGVISYPVFVKPICGSASIAISKVYDQETIELLFRQHDDLMIQEFLDGKEIGADCYIDMISEEVVSVFTKEKIKMRAGETDKAVSFKNENLFSLIERFCKESGYIGQIDIDIFEIDGEYYISEVNPRFGGGYPHAYEAGCNHMKMIQNNIEGVINRKSIGQYEENLYMMKYNEIACRKG